jgi:fibro-slime domain-containing protein
MTRKTKSLFQALALLLAFAHIAQSQAPPATITLTATIRDFLPDQVNFEGQIGDDRNLVKIALGADSKPVYNGPAGGTLTTSPLNSGPGSFDKWYTKNTDLINIPLTLTADGNNVYTLSVPKFFPIDGLLLGNDGTDGSGVSHNFHFTMEVHSQFTYQQALNQVFTFSGDDDVWVFINGQLAIDLGGVHGTETASVQLNDLGLTDGQTYPLDFFYNERHTVESNFMMQTTLVLQPACNKCLWRASNRVPA